MMESDGNDNTCDYEAAHIIYRVMGNITDESNNNENCEMIFIILLMILVSMIIAIKLTMQDI